MTLTESEAQELGQAEEKLWQSTHRAILSEIHQTSIDVNRDRVTARELTNQNITPPPP